MQRYSFGLFVGFANTNRVGICRLTDKNRDRYLEMTVIVAPDANDQKLVDGWPQEKSPANKCAYS
jgi:hypothetical protein